MIADTLEALEAELVAAAPASASVRKDREAIPAEERTSVIVRPSSEAPGEELEGLRFAVVREVLEVLCVATSWELLFALVREVRQVAVGVPGLGLRWTGTEYERQRGGDPPRYEASLTFEREALEAEP